MFDRRPLRLAPAAVLMALAGCAAAQTPLSAPVPPPATAAVTTTAVAPGVPRLPPYLEGREPDTLAILPPPPKDGSLAEQRDFEVFMGTRKLAGTPRWALAAVDAVDYFHGFGCVLGVTISTETSPRLMTLLRRVGGDARLVTDRPKDAYARKRPLYGNAQPICVEDQREGLLKSASYPSGHTTIGWAAGLILAEIAPDKATDILVRARGFGESRAVCGVHFVSDVDAGRTNGAALVAALHGDLAFEADLAAAKAELAALRKTPNPPGGAGQCKAETELAAKTPW